MTFEDLGLNKPLLNALSDLNYTEPTTIQAKAFGPMLAGKDVIGIAQTGTGKTYAPADSWPSSSGTRPAV